MLKFDAVALRRMLSGEDSSKKYIRKSGVMATTRSRIYLPDLFKLYLGVLPPWFSA